MEPLIDRLVFILTFISALGSGLIAGFFLAFSACVMKALARLPQNEGIAAMQSINVVVINPVFLVVFFGTSLTCIGLAAISVLAWSEPRTYYLLAGCLFYLVGTFLLTIMFNVPLNNMLARVDPNSAESAGPWKGYLVRWTAWNHARTAASICAMTLLIMALR
jgi:uncharacterized membrane protein